MKVEHAVGMYQLYHGPFVKGDVNQHYVTKVLF